MKLALVLLLLACTGGDRARARAALDAGDLAGAEAAWRRVLDTEPKDAEALYGLGWTWHLAGQRDSARGAFQQIVTLHPDSPLGYKGLGSVAMADGNLPLARTRLQEALDRAPGDVPIQHSLALANLAAGDAGAALALFDTLAATPPPRAEILSGRAEALLALGRDTEAVDAARAAVALRADGRVDVVARVTLARALLAATTARVSAEDCTGTAPPVYRWLEEADHVLDEAEATGIRAPELVETRRAIRRRRGAVDDQCPGLRAGMGKDFPDDG